MAPCRLSFKTLYVFFFIEHGRRKLVHLNVTAHPTAEWVWFQLQANSLFGLSSNVGTLVGTAVLAPLLEITLGLQAVFIIAGLALLLAAQRAFTARGPARGKGPKKRQGLRHETEVRN